MRGPGPGEQVPLTQGARPPGAPVSAGDRAVIPECVRGSARRGGQQRGARAGCLGVSPACPLFLTLLICRRGVGLLFGG